ncbi:copper chaperone PCu(A)C [Sphingosinicella sp. CPCC 101087]|uniref:copper chaperone PCu(A)C n=1 Tax=Sphingosinicella sp. CPCC 101087 TaxID=2497754 RepID=UPI00101B704C|nr:copper chaperone PCu(A)C [Sphingosinicella sp. CPCC 101087]
MRKALPIIALLLLAPACSREPDPPGVTVENAVATLPAVPGRPGAAYFVLRTNVDPTRLTGIESPRVGRVELHETMEHAGTARMAPLADAGFTPDAPLQFAPGGRHAMLFDMDPALRVGDRLTLTFRFDPAPPVTVEAEVRGPGDAGHGAH